MAFEILFGHPPKPDKPDPSLERIAKATECICHWTREISLHLAQLLVLLSRATSGTLLQGDFMAITGVQVGGSGNFTVTWNGAMQAGNVPSWSADDTLVTITPAADGQSAAIAVSSSDTSNQFNATVTGVASDGTTVLAQAVIPILPVTPPAPATSGTIDQVS